MTIGILRETKVPADTRVPLTPAQCKALKEEFGEIKVFVQPSSARCFSDREYVRQGITLKEDLNECDILMGVKEVHPDLLIPGKTYFFFSHTIKKQAHNKKLLATILLKKVKLIDYELLTDSKGIRIIGFGRWAGLVGTYHGIRALCLKQGQMLLPLPQDCKGLTELMRIASDCKLPPFRMVVTGDGRVAGGAEEMMNAFGIQKVTVEEYHRQVNTGKAVYVQLDPSKYNKLANGGDFELQHFFNFPMDYESNFNRYCSNTDLLVMAAYWDPRAPVLFTTQQMKEDNFSIQVIADITCDLRGSIPSTIMNSTFSDPYYDYNRFTGEAEPAFSEPSAITVMSIDNLPCGLPREASEDFGHHLMKSILPLFNRQDVENILERATIAKEGQLTENFRHLGPWVAQPD